MLCKCGYNPKKDIDAVNPSGWLDLKEAFVDGVIPGDLDFDESNSNGFEEPSQVGETVREPFQAMRAKDAYKARSKAKDAPSSTPSEGDK